MSYRPSSTAQRRPSARRSSARPATAAATSKRAVVLRKLPSGHEPARALYKGTEAARTKEHDDVWSLVNAVIELQHDVFGNSPDRNKKTTEALLAFKKKLQDACTNNRSYVRANNGVLDSTEVIEQAIRLLEMDGERDKLQTFIHRLEQRDATARVDGVFKLAGKGWPRSVGKTMHLIYPSKKALEKTSDEDRFLRVLSTIRNQRGVADDFPTEGLSVELLHIDLVDGDEEDPDGQSQHLLGPLSTRLPLGLSGVESHIVRDPAVAIDPVRREQTGKVSLRQQRKELMQNREHRWQDLRDPATEYDHEPFDSFDTYTYIPDPSRHAAAATERAQREAEARHPSYVYHYEDASTAPRSDDDIHFLETYDPVNLTGGQPFVVHYNGQHPHSTARVAGHAGGDLDATYEKLGVLVEMYHFDPSLTDKQRHGLVVDEIRRLSHVVQAAKERAA